MHEITFPKAVSIGRLLHKRRTTCKAKSISTIGNYKVTPPVYAKRRVRILNNKTYNSKYGLAFFLNSACVYTKLYTQWG